MLTTQTLVRFENKVCFENKKAKCVGEFNRLFFLSQNK